MCYVLVILFTSHLEYVLVTMEEEEFVLVEEVSDAEQVSSDLFAALIFESK